MTWIGSPSFTPGRLGTRIDRIVIHWMVGTLASADAVFKNANYGTSAHYGIEDSKVHQYVNEGDTAYHAGTWAFNLRSIGIEHSADQYRPASEATYATSAQLVADICRRHGIPCDRAHIVRHSEVIATQCCGTVNIDRIVADAVAILGGTTLPYSDAQYIPYAEDDAHMLYRYHLGRNASADERRSRLNLPQPQTEKDIRLSVESGNAWIAFVRNQFRGILLRDPNDAELKQRVFDLQEYRYTPQAFVAELLGSTERKNKLAQIAEMEKKAGQAVLDVQTVEDNFISRLLSNMAAFFASNKTK